MVIQYYVLGEPGRTRKSPEQRQTLVQLERQVRVVAHLINREDYGLKTLLGANRRVRHVLERARLQGIPYDVRVRGLELPPIVTERGLRVRKREVAERFYLVCSCDGPDFQPRSWEAFYAAELARLLDDRRRDREDMERTQADDWAARCG